MKHQLLIFPIILGLVISACGDDKEPSQTRSGDTVIPLEALAPRDTGYDPANEEAFEDLVYREYAYQATRIPKKQADSLLKSVIAGSKDPGRMNEDLQKAMKPLQTRYDSLARRILADKYGITLDSVQAIIVEVKERRKQGE